MNENIKWIDVDNDMPDDSIEVMVCYDSGIVDECMRVWIGYWDSESFAWRNADGARIENVLHWAEMPEGPKVAA